MEKQEKIEKIQKFIDENQVFENADKVEIPEKAMKVYKKLRTVKNKKS